MISIHKAHAGTHRDSPAARGRSQVKIAYAVLVCSFMNYYIM